MQGKRKKGKALLTILLTSVLTFSMFATPVSAKQGTFYGLLAAAEQNYFRELDSSAALKSGSSATVTLSSAVTQATVSLLRNALSAFRADNLIVFWSNGNSISGKNVTFNKEVDWRDGGSRASRLESDVALVDSKVEEVAAAARQKSTAYEQLLYCSIYL